MPGTLNRQSLREDWRFFYALTPPRPAHTLGAMANHNLPERLIRRALALLPWRLKTRLFETACASLDDPEIMQRLIRRLAPRLNITELTAQGDLGAITSLATDSTIFKQYLDSGSFAPDLTDEISAFLAQGGTYVDIGANIGLTTLPVAQSTPAQCLAFEPDPVNFALLERNLARNLPANRVRPHQLALFDQPATLTLAKAPANIGDHRITRTALPGRETITVQARPLDEFLPALTAPLALKIDTQGAEPFIFAGGRQAIARAGLLAAEFCPFLMRQLGGDIDAMLAQLAGFSAIAVSPGGKPGKPVFLSPNDALPRLRAFLATAQPTDGDYLDLLARR